jgi:two-component system chemotaxis response regulator CheY
MIIVTENATEILVKDLEAAFERNSTDRCLFFPAHHFLTSLHDCLNQTAPQIPSILEQDRIKLYLCDDGDAYLIAHALTRKRIYDLLEHLQSYIKTNTNPNEIVRIFEMANEIHTLLLHAQEKYDVILKKRDDQRRIAEEKLREQRDEQERAILNLKVTDTIKLQVQQKKIKRESFEIQIIDDDIFSCKMVDTLLGKLYDVSKAHNAWEAITHYIQNAPDVVFLDIDMPSANGHDILNKILEIDPDAYVIMLSGHSHQDNITRAMRIGAKGFIGKPFSREKIFSYIEKSPHYLNKKKKVFIHAKK